MAGNKIGGKKAAKTNKRRYGKDFYADIGMMGGRMSRTGGFKVDIVCKSDTCEYLPQGHFIRQCAGHRGGKKSRRS